MHDFENDNGCTVTYDSVRKAMDDEPFTMSLTDYRRNPAVIEAVNQGIDSHLEACYCPDLGDRYEGGERKAGKLVLCRSLDCVVSHESLPVLLRRLFELEDESGTRLASDILTVLEINEYGKFVGREAVGMA